MIAIRGLRKHFGHVEAVRDVTFGAADGTVTGLLGPNGAGKTTTLRMLSGLMRPDVGKHPRRRRWMWWPTRSVRSVRWACCPIRAGSIRG